MSTEVHEIVEKREETLKEWIRDTFELNNEKLLAQFSTMLFERDKTMLEAIHEQEKNMAVMAEGVRNLKDEMRVYHSHNDSFKAETRESIRDLEKVQDNAKGVVSGSKGAWIVGTFAVTLCVTVGIPFLVKLIMR